MTVKHNHDSASPTLNIFDGGNLRHSSEEKVLLFSSLKVTYMSDIEVKGGSRSDKRKMLHRYSTIPGIRLLEKYLNKRFLP